MAKKKKKRSKVSASATTTGRALRTKTGRKTKDYKPYKPRGKYQKRKKGPRKPNLFIEFRTCFSKEIRERGYTPPQLITTEGVSGFKTLSAVVSYVWSRLPREEKKNPKYLCEHTDLVFERFFVLKDTRRRDLEELNKLYDSSVWWNVHDEFIPDLFRSVMFKPDRGDRAFLSGFVNGNIRFFEGKWIEFLPDMATANMFYDRCKAVFNARENKEIFISPVPELSLVDSEITPENTINLYYELTSQHGDSMLRTVNPNANMDRDDRYDKSKEDIKPQPAKAPEKEKISVSESLRLEQEKTRQAEEATKQMKLKILTELIQSDPRPTPQQIIDFTKALVL